MKTSRIMQAGTSQVQESATQTDRLRKTNTATQVGGLQREKNPSEATEEGKQQKGAQVQHMANGKATRESQVQVKLVEAMQLYQLNSKEKQSTVMKICQKKVREREASKKCGTPGCSKLIFGCVAN